MEDTTLMPIGNNSEIVIYQPDSTICLEVRMEAESVWLNLNQLSILFQRDKSVISRHIRNIYSEGELIREATVANFATVQLENGRSVLRQIECYNLDVIISVGYRVKRLLTKSTTASSALTALSITSELP